MYTGWPTRGRAAIHLLYEGVEHPVQVFPLPKRGEVWWNTRELDIDQVDQWYSEKDLGGEPAVDLSLYRVEIKRWFGGSIEVWLVDSYLWLKMAHTFGGFRQVRAYIHAAHAREQFAKLRTLVRPQIG